MSVLLPLKNCKQMFWGHVKKLQSVDKLLIHWWFLLDNQHQKSAGKNRNIHSILTTYNTHMIYNEIWRGENGHCPKVWTAVYSHALKAVHQIMPGGGGGVGGWMVGCWPPSTMFYTNAHNRKNGGNVYNARNCGLSFVMKYSCFISSTENKCNQMRRFQDQEVRVLDLQLLSSAHVIRKLLERLSSFYLKYETF